MACWIRMCSSSYSLDTFWYRGWFWPCDHWGCRVQWNRWSWPDGWTKIYRCLRIRRECYKKWFLHFLGLPRPSTRYSVKYYANSKYFPLGGTNGIIELLEYENDHNQEWRVESECDQVHIVSNLFHTEGVFDHVTIEGVEYSGEFVEIDQIVGTAFSVVFSSDGSITHTGFSLAWSCHVPIIGISCPIRLGNLRLILSGLGLSGTRQFSDEKSRTRVSLL